MTSFETQSKVFDERITRYFSNPSLSLYLEILHEHERKENEYERQINDLNKRITDYEINARV